MAGLKDYTLNPKKGSNKFTKWAGNLMDWQDVGETAKNVGLDAAVYGSQLALSPIAVPVAMATGQSIPDLLGYEAKTKAGQLGSDIYTKGQQIGGSIALGAYGGGNLGTSQALLNQKDNMYKFKSGGLNQYRTINIEKGELLVNPETLEVLDNYNDAPKHPEGKNEIDLRGNREVPVGMAIIPAKMANEFKSASPERKKEIINSLPGFNGEKLGVGVPEVPPVVPPEPVNNDPQMLGYASMATAPAMGFGLYQTLAANKALKKLGKEPYAMYNEQVQPELQASYGFAQGRAADAALRSRYGLSQAQQAQYNQNVGRDINTRMQRAQDIGGGNVGQTVGNIMNTNKIQAAQQQAALDAQLQMQKQQYADRAAQYAEGLAQRIAMARQGQQNQNIAFQQQLRLQKERAYGQAKQQGMENMMNAPMQAASILATYYGGK